MKIKNQKILNRILEESQEPKIFKKIKTENIKRKYQKNPNKKIRTVNKIKNQIRNKKNKSKRQRIEGINQ